MNRKLAYIGVFVAGIVLSGSVVFNAELAKLSTGEISTFANQLSCLIPCLIGYILFRKTPAFQIRPGKVKLWKHFSAAMIVLMIPLQCAAIDHIGATMTTVGIILGQSIFGLLCDTFGLFGMEKQKITARRMLSLLVSLSGLPVMSKGGKLEPFYLLLAIISGCLMICEMVWNSALAKEKGSFYSLIVAVGVGSVLSLIYAFAFFPDASISGLKALPHIPLWILMGGGFLGTIGTAINNVSINRIPAIHTAILACSGQILTSLSVDWLLYDIFSLPMFLGAVIMLLGMLVGKEKATN